MKHNVLRSIAHNIADSLASGVGLMIGQYELDVFGEAGRSPEGILTVDFLAGRCIEGTPSASLARAIGLYKTALIALCGKHRTTVSAFRVLSARYSSDPHVSRFVVTVEDQRGRRSVDAYVGTPGRRAMVRDGLGRPRCT